MLPEQESPWIRDLNMIRDILLQMEAGEIEKLDEESQHDLKLANHLRLLIDAELIHGHITTYVDGTFSVSVGLLRWSGHEFLDTLRSPDAYNKMKIGILRAGGWSLPVLQQVGAELLKKVITEGMF